MTAAEHGAPIAKHLDDDTAAALASLAEEDARLAELLAPSPAEVAMDAALDAETARELQLLESVPAPELTAEDRRLEAQLMRESGD